MTETFGNYKLIGRVKLDFMPNLVVSKWRSHVTGLTVVHVDDDAPIVRGNFVVPTEIFDDSGCPHTLEHLVFMGSEKYPHKGSLSSLINRAFSDGGDASTTLDRTSYTVSTAGGQGLLQLLPVYVDHILYPTITNASFVTEVHHIDGNGRDSGVVYCEMQGVESEAFTIMYLRLQRLLDAPDSAYRSVTGGSMKELRKLTPEKIREFHARYYVPHNLTLIVMGKLAEGTPSLLRVVQEQVEPSLIQHNQNKGFRPAGWKRPLLETPSAQSRVIPATVKSVVEFPAKDQSTGNILIGFIGPPPNDILARTALDMLGAYLSISTTAPLNKEYIEIESLCAHINFWGNMHGTTHATDTTLVIAIYCVLTKNLFAFDEKLTASLKRIVQNGIDMQRMGILINKTERELRRASEGREGSTFYHVISDDAVYGAEDGSDLYPWMDRITNYNILRSWTSCQWTKLLSKFYIEQPSAVVIGTPSANLADNLEKAEKARIARRVEQLGPEGLKQAERILEVAREAQSRPVPTEVLTSFPVPDVKSICWIPVQTVQEPGMGRKANPNVASTDEELRKYIESDGKPLPFFVQYNHIKSDFVSIHAFFSLAKLPNHLRPYFAVYLSAFFSLPVVRHNGVRLTHEEVTNQLDNDTVFYEATLGFPRAYKKMADFANMFCVAIKVEHSGYETAIAWLKDLIYGSEFDKERIQIVLAKIQKELSEEKRDQRLVRRSLWADLMYMENSTERFMGVLHLVEFVPMLIRRLQESPEDVVADFECIRKHIIDPAGVRFSVSGNILSVNRPRSTWGKYFGPTLLPTPLSPVPLASETLSAIGRNCSRQAIVMSLPATESSFTFHTTNSIQGFDHPEYPAIRIALEVLNGMEGYLWRHIRGSGLTYDAAVGLDDEAGLLYFSLFRSTNPIKAFDKASSMMHGLVDGSIELTDTAIVAAVSAIVYTTTEHVSVARDAALHSFINQALKGVPRTHQIDLFGKYQTIKKGDIIAAFKKYFLPLFDPASSVVVVVTAPGNTQDIECGLTCRGFHVTQKVEPSWGHAKL